MITYDYHPEGELLRLQDSWGEHTEHPRSVWKHEVGDGSTSLGYWEWLSDLLYEDDEYEDAIDTVSQEVICNTCGTAVLVFSRDGWGGVCHQCIERLNIPSATEPTVASETHVPTDTRVAIVMLSGSDREEHMLSNPVSRDAFLAWREFVKCGLRLTLARFPDQSICLALATQNNEDFRIELCNTEYSPNSSIQERIHQDLEDLLLSTDPEDFADWKDMVDGTPDDEDYDPHA